MARRGTLQFGINVSIDLHKLAAALKDVADSKERDKITYRAINDCLDRLNTVLKRDLQKWTGIKLQRRIAQGMRIKRAGPGHLEGAVIIKDKHIVISKEYFGARFKKGDSGVSHTAWGRAQVANRAFMIAGRKPAFHHIANPSKHRGDLKVVWGPNPAREAQRHADEVRASTQLIVLTHLIPRVTHGVDRAFKDAKGKHGAE